MRNAIVYFSHRFGPAIVRQIEKLARESVSHGNLILLYDEQGDRPPVGYEAQSFNVDVLRRKYPGFRGDSLIPGNCHFPLLDLFETRPGYEHYWIIEYDVRYSGHWGQFFQRLQNKSADLLACHVRRYADEPTWMWWDTVRSPTGKADPRTLLRSFNPIYRISAAGLRTLCDAVRHGWEGHHEAVVPSVLHAAGNVIEDMGGDGEFVRGVKNQFYTSDCCAELLSGTLRCRPTHGWWGFRRNVLYHPVKPVDDRPSTEFRRAKRWIARQLLNLTGDTGRAPAA
jgi:hypothetical protein